MCPLFESIGKRSGINGTLASTIEQRCNKQIYRLRLGRGKKNIEHYLQSTLSVAHSTFFVLTCQKILNIIFSLAKLHLLAQKSDHKKKLHLSLFIWAHHRHTPHLAIFSLSLSRELTVTSFSSL